MVEGEGNASMMRCPKLVSFRTKQYNRPLVFHCSTWKVYGNQPLTCSGVAPVFTGTVQLQAYRIDKCQSRYFEIALQCKIFLFLR